MLIGLWVVFASLVVADTFIYHYLLLASTPWLSGFVNIMIFVLIPIVAASWLLDWRTTQRQEIPPPPAPRPLPSGVRSVSGEQLSPPRPRLRLRRDKRAERLETIVVKPENAPSTPVRTTMARETLSSTPPGPETVLEELVVEQQLEEIERGIAKLEEEIKETVPPSSMAGEPIRREAQVSTQIEKKQPLASSSVPSSEEEASISPSVLSEEELLRIRSDLQAVQQLLEQLESKRKMGDVSPAVYNRLRAKYLKQKEELETKLAGT